VSAVRVAAVDLGASSGRVVIGYGTERGFSLREVHRFPNQPRPVDGVLRWDARALFAGILDGLRAATVDGRLDAVSVDGWGVDYGLLDGDGGLIADPACYRDPRTEAPFAALTEADAERLYQATGIAVHPFNTVFQLMADRDLDRARHAVLVPDLMTYWLSGQLGTELTNASTTGLLDTRVMGWADQVAEAMSVRTKMFPRLRAAGDVAGPAVADLGPAVFDRARPPQVIVGPSHDTAAAVAGVPAAGEGFAFVCTGTWALVGVELPVPVITGEARRAGFSNEAGVDGTIRFLRNVTGFWLLQECAREWGRVDLDELTRAAGRVAGLRALIDVQDPAFLPPGGMTWRITRACQRVSGVALSGEAEILRCILDSMAVAIRHAVREAARLTGRPAGTVHVVGGGVANALFCQLVADACQLPVVAGPTEAACWGNTLIQARALGAAGRSLPELRSLVRQAVRLTEYRPEGAEQAWARAEEIVLASRS
jgi:rhamnulokinase